VTNPLGEPFRRATIYLIAMLAAVAFVGCDSSGPTTATPTTTVSDSRPATPTTAPTPSRSATEAGLTTNAAVLAAYRAYWSDVITAGKSADWQSPQLDDHATGLALRQAKATLLSLKARGLVARGTVKLDPEVISLAPPKAVVYDCNNTSNFLAYDAKTGQLRDKSSGRPNGKTVTLLLNGGSWKVSQATTEAGKCTR
jgi:hypothetical protein